MKKKLCLNKQTYIKLSLKTLEVDEKIKYEYGNLIAHCKSPFLTMFPYFDSSHSKETLKQVAIEATLLAMNTSLRQKYTTALKHIPFVCFCFQLHIKVIDVNDNAPIFVQKTYNVTVGENLSLRPPTPVVQVRAEDKDASYNGQIKYTLLEQTEQGN